MSRWLARWRAALRIARRDAWRNKGRTVLVVLLMMLPVAAGTFVVGVLKSSRPTTETTISWEMGSTAQARLALPCGAQGRAPTKQDASGRGICGPDGADLGELTEMELAAALPSGDGAVPAAEAYLDLRTDQALIDGAQVVQTDATAVPGLLGEVTGEGVPAEGEAVLGSAVAERLGVTVGDHVELMVGGEPLQLAVAGIGQSTSRTAALLGPGTLPDGAAQPVWFVTGEEPVTWEHVLELNEIGLAVISRAVLNDPPPPAEVYGGMFAPPDSGGRLAGTLLAVGGLVLLETILLIGPAFAVGAKRSARSLALVASAGGEPADLRRIVLAGGLVAGLVAAVVGILVGTAAGLIVHAALAGSSSPPANLVLPVWEPAAIGAIALILGVAAAWFPARTASRADVVTVLAGRRGEPPVRHRVAWIGLGLGAVGVAMSIMAAVSSQPVLLAAGVITLELGLVMAAGALVALAGRLAPRLGVAGRFALRDAHRHRSRTAPAVAAVLAAVAAATAGMIWVAGNAQMQEEIWQPVAADGTGLLGLNGWSNSPERLEEQYQEATDLIAAEHPDAAIAAVYSLTHVDSTTAGPTPAALPNPETVCPDPAVRGPDAEDERCRFVPTHGAGFSWAFTIVDDGALAGSLGLDGADEAAQALADGHALTNDPDSVWPDGNLHVALLGNSPDPVSEEILVPAHLVDWTSQQFAMVLPTDAAEELIAADRDRLADEPGTDAAADGLAVVPVGASVTGVEFAQTDVDRLNRQLNDVDPNVRLSVEGELNQQDTAAIMLIVLGVALFVALAATGLSVGLAVADSRADLATLAAVGASPRMRRRVSAAQAGVIAGIGTATGVTTGLLLGYVLGLWQSAEENFGAMWQTVVPWPQIALLLVALPLLAIGAGWLFTRSRLPVRRRAVS